MKTATAARLSAEFDQFLDETREQPVLITRNGKPVALLVAVKDKAEAERLATRSRTLRSVFEESQARVQQSGAIPHDQFWRDVEPPPRRRKRVARRRTA